MASDFNLFKSLWSNINDACAPPPPPGAPAKACFLMEMPGFTVDPDVFNPKKFIDKPAEISPDYATALLCDRVPALAQYFYDTGSHISFFWEQLVRTFRMKPSKDGDASLKAEYDEAIKMLYGDNDGYVHQKKTPLFSNLDALRDNWGHATKEKNDFYSTCKDDTESWPQNFEMNAPYYTDKVNAAFTEYDNLKLIIQKYEAAIFAYASGDQKTMMLEQEQKLGQHRMSEAGEDGAGDTFYQTILEPANWWTWFDETKDADDEGWTEVIITQKQSYQSASSAFSQVSVETQASYGGLFFSGSISGGYSKKVGNKSLITKDSKVEIKFKVRKVTIQRPWLETALLDYPTIGIEGLGVDAWSTGKLEAATNKGQFPLLPTAFVVAKDVTISGSSILASAASSSSKSSTHASAKVGIGCFSASGNYSSAKGSKCSTSTYHGASKTLEINGAQIIGWVCECNPQFPQFQV